MPAILDKAGTRFIVTPELTHELLHAKRRHDARITSMLEAAIEQMEAIHAVNHIPHSTELIDALKAYNDGDVTKLNQFLCGTSHMPHERKPNASHTR